MDSSSSIIPSSRVWEVADCNSMASAAAVSFLEKPPWNVLAVHYYVYHLSVLMAVLASCQEARAFPFERKPSSSPAGWVWSSNPPKKLSPSTDSFKTRAGGSSVLIHPQQHPNEEEVARSRFYRTDHHQHPPQESYNRDPLIAAHPISGLNSHQNFYHSTGTSHGSVRPYPPFPPFEDHSSDGISSAVGTVSPDGCYCLKKEEVSCAYPAASYYQDQCLSYEILCCKEPRYASDSPHSSGGRFQPVSSPAAAINIEAGDQSPAIKAGLAIQEAYQTQTYGQNYNQYYQPATGPGLLPELYPPAVFEPAFNPAIAAGPGGYFPEGPQFYPSGNYPAHQQNHKYLDYAKWFSTFVTGLFLGTQGANLIHTFAAKKQYLEDLKGAGDPSYNNPYNHGSQNGGAVFFKLPFTDSTFWKLWGLNKGGSLPFGKNKKKAKVQDRKSDERVTEGDFNPEGKAADGKGETEGISSVEEPDYSTNAKPH